MTVYLLDTNVVSEMAKRRPNARVSAWLSATPDCYLSVLTVGELIRGIEKLRSKDPARADKLGSWVRTLRRDYSGRVLDVDEDVVDQWALPPHDRTLPVIDALIAATAKAHEMTVATRNTKDFEGLGVPTFNPFA